VSKTYRKHKQWTFYFKNEIEDAYWDDDRTDPLWALKQDATGVPMITGLDETKPVEPYLQVGKNIFFEIIDDD
jgi:hypothetical protein